VIQPFTFQYEDEFDKCVTLSTPSCYSTSLQVQFKQWNSYTAFCQLGYGHLRSTERATVRYSSSCMSAIRIIRISSYTDLRVTGCLLEEKSSSIPGVSQAQNQHWLWTGKGVHAHRQAGRQA
jgi:hypothetical protein